MTNRLDPAARTAQLLAVALELATASGVSNLTRKGIAEAASVSEALVTERLGTLQNLRRDVFRHAVKKRVLSVIAEGLAMRDPHCMRAKPEVRAAALGALA